jgi:hypothetical protein
MRTDKGWIGELHLRARVENGKLVDEQILCLACGNSAKTVTAYDAGGAPTALLAPPIPHHLRNLRNASQRRIF